MKHVVIILLLLPISSFSQEPDSLKQKIFENFFGSECSEDTVILNIGGKYDQCILYKKEDKVCRRKNGKIKWTLDLNSELDSPNVESVCVFWQSGKTKARNVRIRVLAEISGVSWSVDLKYHSGKIEKKQSSLK